ncbi:MAG: hypothetical protein MJ054_01170 [Clostridia bacterium]|nr:hypothetical protein [Clostridia bacterium]
MPKVIDFSGGFCPPCPLLLKYKVYLLSDNHFATIITFPYASFMSITVWSALIFSGQLPIFDPAAAYTSQPSNVKSGLVGLFGKIMDVLSKV